MISEQLFNSNNQAVVRVGRAFKWVITFRDYPAESYQVIRGKEMMSEAITLFTKGRAEFFLDDVKRGDRVPGILSTEHELVGEDGTFKLVYTEPTTRLCIYAGNNKDKLPIVNKLEINAGESVILQPGFKGLVCLGSVTINGKVFDEERTFIVGSVERECVANSKVIILEFLS
jgi:hypothetical protein